MFLDPAKLLVVLVIALIVLGPDKLPQVSRQLGAMWGDLRRWRARLENEMRDTFPDLPPTHEVVQAVRSPLAFLDRLADAHENSARGEVRQITSSGSDPANSGPDGSAGTGVERSAYEAVEAAHNGAGVLPAEGAGASQDAPAPARDAPGASEEEDPKLPELGVPVAREAHPGAGLSPVPDDPSMN